MSLWTLRCWRRLSWRLKNFPHEGKLHLKASQTGQHRTVRGVNQRLTFFMGVDGADMALQMLSTMETFAAPIDFADIHTLFRLSSWNLVQTLGGRNASSSTLFGEVGNRDREDSTAARYPALTLSIFRRRYLKESDPGCGRGHRFVGDGSDRGRSGVGGRRILGLVFFF